VDLNPAELRFIDGEIKRKQGERAEIKNLLK
jgi:hypothetical protein